MYIFADAKRNDKDDKNKFSLLIDKIGKNDLTNIGMVIEKVIKREKKVKIDFKFAKIILPWKEKVWRKIRKCEAFYLKRETTKALLDTKKKTVGIIEH